MLTDLHPLQHLYWSALSQTLIVPSGQDWFEGNGWGNILRMIFWNRNCPQNTYLVLDFLLQNSGRKCGPKIVALWFFYFIHPPVFRSFTVHLIVLWFTTFGYSCFSKHMCIVVNCCKVRPPYKCIIPMKSNKQTIYDYAIYIISPSDQDLTNLIHLPAYRKVSINTPLPPAFPKKHTLIDTKHMF